MFFIYDLGNMSILFVWVVDSENNQKITQKPLN